VKEKTNLPTYNKEFLTEIYGEDLAISLINTKLDKVHR
jgi:hypothetical protein